MIKVTYISNTQRNTTIVEENAVIRDVLDGLGVNYSAHTVNIDGCIITPAMMKQTFAEMGVGEECIISCVVKSDNANA